MCEAGDAFEIHVVFDRYLESSLKESAREKRGRRLKVTKCEIADNPSLNKIHSMRKILSHINTKQRLTIYLGRYLSNARSTRGKRFVISYNTRTVSNIPEIDGRFDGNTHEEADTLMLLHAIDVAHLNPFRHVSIISPDTSVFLLLIHYYPQIPVLVSFESGSQRSILLRLMKFWDLKKSNAPLGFHAFTGCDKTSKFNRKSKATCWKAFLNASEDVLNTFVDLGVPDDLADLKVTSLEKYVVRLFCESGDLYSLTDARWSMYTKQQDCDNLPPTKAVLKFKVSRCHLIRLIWKSSHLQIPKYCHPTTLR